MHEYVIFALGIGGSIIAYLLARKDDKQAEEMKAIADKAKEDADTLFKLVHKQQADLADFKLRIAENHYPKHELDQKFSQLNTTMSEGFKNLGSDIREMTKVMNNHFHEHTSGGQ